MKKYLIIALSFLFVAPSSGSAPSNLLRHYSTNFWPFTEHAKKYYWATSAAAGFCEQGRNQNGSVVNPAQTWNAYQDALAMLKGFPAGSPQAQLGQQLNINDDNGTRGHFIVTGKFHVPISFFTSLRFILPEGFFIEAGIPFYALKFNHLQWIDQTPSQTFEDALTKELLTNHLSETVYALGDGLTLSGWQRSGFGDATLFTGWSGKFLQQKEWIKEVLVHMRVGVSFPTGIKVDENAIMSFPFGNDGAFAIPFGAGLDIRFKELCWVGGHLSFMHTFDHTRNRRIATNAEQTSFLYLQRALARKEYGFLQMVNLYIEPRLYKGLSFRFAYEHIKQGDAKLHVLGSEFSTQVANTAVDLKEWTTHQLTLQLRLDTGWQEKECGMCPQFSLFAIVPVNGRNSVQTHMLGASVGLSF